MYSQTFDYTAPLATLVYKYLNLIFGRSYFIHYGFSSLVIVFQAGIFNQLLLKNKAYDENSYLPAFLYTILMISVPDFMTLSPQLMSLTFILLALRNVLRRIDNQVTDELFLNSGIYIGIATMIYLPSFVFFLVFSFCPYSFFYGGYKTVNSLPIQLFADFFIVQHLLLLEGRVFVVRK